ANHRSEMDAHWRTHYAICDGVRYRSTVQSRSKGAAAAANLTISLAAARMTQSTPAQEICLTRDRCRNGPHLDFCAAGFLWHIKQKLAAAQINGSRPFPRTIDSLLAETRDRLILKSQLTPGLDAGLHRRALANIIVEGSRTRCCA